MKTRSERPNPASPTLWPPLTSAFSTAGSCRIPVANRALDVNQSVARYEGVKPGPFFRRASQFHNLFARYPMTMSSSVRALVLVGLSTLVFGCASGATWSQVRTRPSYQPPKQVKVAIVARTAGDSYMPDAIKELQNSMAKELSTRGITAAFIPAPMAPR